jgi:SAM-dependent methyltransferase
MAAETGPSPELFFHTANAYQQTAALRTAVELNLFTAIGERAPATAAAIATHCRASERGIRILCDYLAILGFLQKAGNTYSLTPSSALFLSKGSPTYVGGAVEFLTSPEIVRTFDQLTEAVRSGGANRDESTVVEDHPVWVTFARAMAPLMMPAAQAIAGLVGNSGAPMRVLDIAAGHGIFGIVVAKQNPRAEVVALDWPRVLDVADENARVFGVANRYRRLEGDAMKVDLGTGYQVVLVTNFLHHFSPDECTTFLTRVAASLAPGGRVAILEFVPNEDRVTPPAAAGFSLMMLASTPSGDAYTFPELRGFLEAAGFHGVSLHPVQAGQAVIVATR